MKFKYFIYIILVSIFIILLTNTTCYAKEKYTIDTVEDLIKFASEVNGGNSFAGQTVYLMESLDLEGSEDNQWTPIGTGSNKFEGTFEGNGYTISGIYIKKDNYDDVAFFGENSGTIKNLGVYGEITGKHFLAGLCAENNGTIEKCFSEVTLTGKSINIGGIAAWNGGVRY